MNKRKWSNNTQVELWDDLCLYVGRSGEVDHAPEVECCKQAVIDSSLATLSQYGIGLIVLM